MVSFPDLRDIDPYVFRQGETNWFDMYTQVKERGYEIRRALDKLELWTGSAADGAKAIFREHERRLLVSADTLHEGYQLFHQAGDRIGVAKAKIMEGAGEVASWNLSVADDGTIFDEHIQTRYGSEEQRIRDLISKYLGVFREAMTEANRADQEIAAGLRRLTAEAVGLAPPGGDATTAAAAMAIPPRGTAPAEANKWWDSLSPMQQESLLFTRAAELGMLDGVPVAARDRANRFRLAEEKAELLADQQRLLAKHRNHDEDLWLKQVNDKLHGIEDIEKRLNTIDPNHKEAFLLAIDGTGNGRAIIAAGNPDTATNVATYVPGTGAHLSKVGGDINRADLMLQAAANAGSPSTAVITWVGYDAPQNIIPEAAYERFADGAKKDLDRFQDGLRATHEGAPSHNTVLGHSYGSTVIGHAARDDGLDADELVFVGSPGVGVGNAGELNLPTDHVYATVAEHDTIHLSNIEDPHDVHGPDPTGSQFGAHVFTSDPGTEGPWYTGGYSGEAHSHPLSRIWARSLPARCPMRTSRTVTAAAFLLVVLIPACSSTEGTMHDTITAAQAEQRAADYVRQFLATLPVRGRPEMTFQQTSECADPTDNGPRGRVFASIVYQIHDVPISDTDSYFAAAHQWWTTHDFRVSSDWKPGSNALRVENNKDSFRMALTANDTGVLILATDSPCVWPKGTPAPEAR